MVQNLRVPSDLAAAIAPAPIVVSPDTTVATAIATLQPSTCPTTPQHRSCVVVSQGQVVGLVTAEDLLGLALTQTSLGSLPLGQVILPGVVTLTLTPTLSVATAIAHLQQHQMRPLPVVDAKGTLLGLLTPERLLALAEIDPPPGPPNQPTAPPTKPDQARETDPHPTWLPDILAHTKACLTRFRLYPDQTWAYDYYSQGALSLYGYSPETLKNQPDLWRSRVLPEDLETVIFPASEAVRQGATKLDLEFRFRHRDGSLRWIGESCTARWDAAQRCWVVTTIDVDITPRKRLETQLRQSEAELRGLFEAMDDVVLVLDQEGRYRQVVSANACDLYLPAAELQGKRIGELFPPDQAQFFLTIIRQVLATGQSQEVEYALTLAAKTVWFSARCSPMTADQVIWVARNISDRKRMELELQAAHDRYHLVLQSIGEGIWDWDPATDVAITSERFWQILGSDPPPAYATTLQACLDLIHPEDRDRLQAAIHAHLDQEQRYDLEIRFRHGHGHYLWGRVRGQAVRDPQGHPLRMVGTLEDISDRKQAELALRQSEAKSRTILATLPDLTFRLGADGRYREVLNPRPDFEMFFQGQNPVGLRLADLVPAAMATHKLAMAARALATGDLQLYEQQFTTDAGERYEEVRVIKSGEDEVLFMIRDISDRKRAEADLHRTRHFLQQILDHLPVAVFAKEAHNLRFTLWNPACQTLMGYAPEAVLGKTDYDLFPAEQAQTCIGFDQAAIRTGEVVDVPEETIVDGQGCPRITHNRKVAVYDTDGSPQFVISMVEDITAYKQVEATVKQQLAAIEATVDGIGILKEGVYIYVNQAHLTLFGYGHPTDLVGKTWQCLYSAAEIQRFEADVFPTLQRDRTWQGEAIATRRDGSTFAEGLSLTLTDEGTLICVCRDITDLKATQAQLLHTSLHDPLTGLPNRTLLLERLETAIHRAQRQPASQYAVLFLDLDRFKVINDSLGHGVGDQLLIAIAQKLQTHVRAADLVARLGGDEFVLLLENIHSSDAVVGIAERILADCQAPLTFGGNEVVTGVSIGIALGTPAYTQAADLIRDADIAMYRAKHRQRGTYQFFDPAMHHQVLAQHTLEMELYRAIDQGELTVYYQPVIDIAHAQLVGFEALVRWLHPSRGLLTPDVFLPCAENTGLIVTLDRWVLQRACQQLRTWQQRFPAYGHLRMGVNLSAQQFATQSLLEAVTEILATTGMPGSQLTLEVTEKTLIQDLDQAAQLLSQLAAQGIQISIDDFGVGHSSLQYLHRFPLTTLKIDRSFVEHIVSDRRDYAMVKLVFGLSQQLGLSAIAEGIETPEQLHLIQALGCPFAQGYFFAPPLAAHRVETYLAAGTTATLPPFPWH